MHQRDEADAGISNLVFDVNKKERPPSRCCSKSSVWSNIFCSSQYHSFNDQPLLHCALSFVRNLRRKIDLDCIVVKFSWLYFTKFKTMNKVILTYDRVFMSIGGPSGSGKTELIFHMLQGNSFYPRFEKFITFARSSSHCSEKSRLV